MSGMQRYVFYWKRKNPFPKSVINDKNREWKWPYMWFFSKMEWFDVDTWKTTWTTFTTSNNARTHRLFEAHADQGLLQDCNTREACRLLLVVKVVFVVFPNSGGRVANSTNPITRFFGWTPFMWFTFKTSYCSSPKTHWEVSGIFHIHSRKLTQMTKIGNGLYVLVLLNENEHGCSTEQAIATRSDSDSSYTIPFVGEQELKMW